MIVVSATKLLGVVYFVVTPRCWHHISSHEDGQPSLLIFISTLITNFSMSQSTVISTLPNCYSCVLTQPDTSVTTDVERFLIIGNVFKYNGVISSSITFQIAGCLEPISMLFYRSSAIQRPNVRHLSTSSVLLNLNSAFLATINGRLNHVPVSHTKELLRTVLKTQNK